MSKLNIILPCAGAGTRLGLPYPKEVFILEQDKALIDYTFSALLTEKDFVKSVTIVLTPEKVSIVNYLKKWSDHFYIRFCYFNPKYTEWAGSIRSSAEDFSDKNVVLLPDSIITPERGYPILGKFDELLSENDIVFAYKREKDPDKLKNLGALEISAAGAVKRFCDKPQSKHELYNAFWCSFGFRKEIGDSLLQIMQNSIAKKSVDLADISKKIGSFPVESYRDLGTWESIEGFHRIRN